MRRDARRSRPHVQSHGWRASIDSLIAGIPPAGTV